MSRFLHSHSEELAVLLKAIGAPANVTSITIHAQVDSILKVDISYYPSVDAHDMEEILAVAKKYKLVERGEDE